MKLSVVPAQVTSIEDKIASNISLHQLILLVSPVFFGMLSYVALPPFTRLVLYKVIVLILIVAICFISALRIQGTLVLFHVLIRMKYNQRPRYYVFNKNDQYLRTDFPAVLKDNEPAVHLTATEKQATVYPALNSTDSVRLDQLIHADASLSFKPHKRGGGSVIVTEIKH